MEQLDPNGSGVGRAQKIDGVPARARPLRGVPLARRPFGVPPREEGRGGRKAEEGGGDNGRLRRFVPAASKRKLCENAGFSVDVLGFRV